MNRRFDERKKKKIFVEEIRFTLRKIDKKETTSFKRFKISTRVPQRAKLLSTREGGSLLEPNDCPEIRKGRKQRRGDKEVLLRQSV